MSQSLFKPSSITRFSKSFGLLLGTLLLLSACSDDDYYNDDGGTVAVTECSTIGQNRFVYDTLSQWYYWNSTLPDINPDTYASPEAVLDAMIVNAPVTDRFSYITDKQASDDFFSKGQFTGLGFTSRNIDNRLFLALVFSDSPAALAGLKRGDEIISINNVNVNETLTAGNSVDFGDSTVGTTTTIEYLDSAGDTFTKTIVKDNVNVDTVPVSSVIDNNGVPTGYLHFYTFIEPSTAALNAAFQQFTNAGVSELVVDVRYNGGGLVTVANYLSGLIGGTTTAGEVLSKRLHNAQRVGENETTTFSDQPNALDLNRVVFITGGGSASASELVINSLQPFLDVVLVGDTTFGKPVGQYGFDFCDNTLFPVSFETVNANDEGGYFEGLTADCSAPDDLAIALGNTAEASLAEALVYLDTGACSPVSAATANKVRLNANEANQSKLGKIEIIESWKLLNAN